MCVHNLLQFTYCNTPHDIFRCPILGQRSSDTVCQVLMHKWSQNIWQLTISQWMLVMYLYSQTFPKDYFYIFLLFLLTWVTCDIQWILKMDLMSKEINWIWSFDWAKSIKASNTVGRADFFSLFLNGFILRSLQSEKKMAEGAGQRRVGVIADINDKYMMNIYLGWVLQISAGRQ